MARFQLGLWGIDYFDLFLVHFPVALKYVGRSTVTLSRWPVAFLY
jgi:D-xylose reductase